MNTAMKVLVISVVMFFAGCASLPSPEKMKEEVAAFELPKLPEDQKAIVYIVRPSILGGVIWFNVFVDDQEAESEMGYTRGAQYINFNLEPGSHKILSKAENWAEIDFTAAPGDIIFIQQDPTMGLLIARNSLRKLQEYEGKYQVKHLTLGTIIKTNK